MEAIAGRRGGSGGGRRMKRGRTWALVALALTVSASSAASQIPQEATNLRVLPEDLPRDSLIEIMRGFSFSLGVRCQYCHTGGDGISFEGVDFADDGDPDKVKARAMLRMVARLNDEFLAELPERDTPEVTVACATCHRGRPRPSSLADELLAALDASGPDSAVALYDRLRDDEGLLLRGSFDFGEWPTNVLGERLAREGRSRDAIAIYALNARWYPESVSIQLALAELYEEVDDVPAAIAALERALELRPENPRVQARLEALRQR